MKFPLPADTFPTLQLSPEDERKLESAAAAIMQSNIEQYHEHITVHRGVVDERYWMKVKQREDVRVYRERKSSFQPVATSHSGSGSSSEFAKSTVQIDNESFKTMTSLLTFGTIPGDLDDVMYGVLNATTEDMQLKTAYVEDGFSDWAMLASIIKPSEHDPFRDLSLKWSVKKNPLLVGVVMRNRDAFYIESTGIAVTLTGERIGYHLYHSVDIPEIRELTEYQIVRGKVSVCEFFRQRTAKSVEVYSRFVLNAMGDAPPNLLALSVSEVAVSVFKHVHCAEMKKLTRIVGSSQQQALRGTMTELRAALSCALCARSIGRGLSFASAKEKSCRICAARVCSRCRVYKTVFVPTRHREKELVHADMAFCTPCIMRVTSTSSVKFAVLDAVEVEGETIDYSNALHRL